MEPSFTTGINLPDNRKRNALILGACVSLIFSIVTSAFLVIRQPSKVDGAALDAAVATWKGKTCADPQAIAADLRATGLREMLYGPVTWILSLHGNTARMVAARFGESPLSREEVTKSMKLYAEMVHYPVDLLPSQVPKVVASRFYDMKPVPLLPKSVKDLFAKASAGDTESQFVAGYMQLYGFGARRDEKAGLSLLGKAAVAGHGWALKELGYLYSNLNPILVDDPGKAIRFTRRAAACGNPEGMRNLGFMFDSDMVKVKDAAKVFKWTLESARHGNINAQYDLAHKYYDGNVPGGADKNQAAYWYRKAAKAYYPPAAINLATMYHSKEITGNYDEVERPLLFAAKQGIPYAIREIAHFYAAHADKHLKEAFAWLKVYAADEPDWAYAEMGDIYRDGRGVTASQAKAREYYRRAAAAGSAYAAARLRNLYPSTALQSAPGSKADATLGLNALIALGEKGDIGAIKRVAYFYYKGDGVPADPKATFEWYMRGAKLGDPECEGMVGDAYLRGSGTAVDYAEARKWLEKAAEAGRPTSAESLAYIYGNGAGVPQDLAKAEQYYTMAAERGSPTAARSLVTLYQMKGDVNAAKKWAAKAEELDPRTRTGH